MALPIFTMEFEPQTVDDLGLRLYSTLPPVISELVSNAHDAESSKVEITLPVGSIGPTSKVIVRDYGHGLHPNEIQDEFLPIGRKRRGLDGTNNLSKNKKVTLTGRKGLGKLSSFGVASQVEVRFVKDKEAVCLRLDYDVLKKWTEVHGRTAYEPEVITARTGKTNDLNGAEIILSGLRRTSPISEDNIRRGLARRLNFIGKGFVVAVNGKDIGPGDRLNRSECPLDYSWDVTKIEISNQLPSGEKITGWIGFLETSSQVNRGIDIFANGKAAELGSYFNWASTHAQYARAYLVGEINADFLDRSEDLISTARNSVVWESALGHELEKWGQDTLLWVFNQWLALRKKKKEEKITKLAGFDEWLKSRLPTEQKVARRILKLLVDDENIEAGSAEALLEVVKGSVEAAAFHELVDEIEEHGGNVSTLLKLFGEWRVIEAREHLRLADGRFEAISKLKEMMDKGALEVQEVQPLFEKNPWLIDERWSEVDTETTYTKLIRQHCVEPKDYEDVDRRIDILGISSGGTLTIVEIKKPQKTESRRDLEQIEKYVDWARSQFSGTGKDSPKHIDGLLIIGAQSHNADIQQKRVRLAGDDIRVETYGDLHDRAKAYYGAVEKRLKTVAPEYVARAKKKKKS